NNLDLRAVPQFSSRAEHLHWIELRSGTVDPPSAGIHQDPDDIESDALVHPSRTVSSTAISLLWGCHMGAATRIYSWIRSYFELAIVVAFGISAQNSGD
ncbi:5087_t:CDS:2, partial [Acaulospora colombiana]